ncbi:MAG: hypothetical protein A2W25_01675 [candidate division Zixibacteria bacterium RBG_16_53_22]|nr:MAG: hypothetical protein A2W25_01675 [candidate division Zixibacteria bacterium RBG_16_53_22]
MSNGPFGQKLFQALLRIDRRIIFLVIFLALSIPIFLGLRIDITVTQEVRLFYNSVEALSSGSRVLLSFDYDPGSEPELQPMAETGFRHLIKNHIKFIIMGLWPQGPMQANKALTRINEVDEGFLVDNGDTLYFGRDLLVVGPDTIRYGIDFINLGFQAGNELVIQRMGSSIRAAFANDARYGRPIDQFPIMNGLNKLSDFDLVINWSAGYPGTVEWVQFAVDRFHVPCGAGNTAVQAPQVYPYLDTGQLSGLMGGMKGGAEYEQLTGMRAKATMSMVSQTAAHIFVVLFIVIGNLAYFMTRGRKKEGRA